MNKNLERNIKTRLLTMLFEKKFSIYVMSFGTMCIFSYIIYNDDIRIKFYFWWSSFCIYLGLRYFTTSYYETNLSKANNDPYFFEKLNAFNALYGGTVWGVSSLLFFQHVSPVVAILAMGIYLGSAAGSLTTNAASMKASISYLMGLFLPVIVAGIVAPFEYSYYVSAMSVMAILGYIKGANVIYKSLYKSVRTSIENEELVRQVAFTNQKRIEAEKQSLQSSKLATLGEMAAGIAHEINNPLTIISGNIEMIEFQLRKINARVDLTRYVESCERNISRITNLVSSLKRMSYNNKEEVLEDVELNTIFEDAFSFSKEKMKHDGIKFSINVDDSSTIVNCNSLYVSQVLLNLVNNAIHAISKHEDPWIKITNKRDKNYIYIEVTDSGKGIATDVADKIFNPFFTTKDINNGTGLGLSLSKNMAIRSGGDLNLDRGHKNTRFILKIPLSIQDLQSNAS